MINEKEVTNEAMGIYKSKKGQKHGEKKKDKQHSGEGSQKSKESTTLTL